jgi:superfamily I DNA/RNA helicase
MRFIIADELLAVGVPPEWLTDVREATEDTYLELSDHLPHEAAEAQLNSRQAITSRELIKKLLRSASEASESKFLLSFLFSEWEQVVDASQLDSWESYRDVVRLGRQTRLPEKQRVSLWAIFDQVREALRTQKQVTQAEMFSRLASALVNAGRARFDVSVIDEAQDLSIPQLRCLAAMDSKWADAFFFTGDLGQPIVQQPFFWNALGVDVRGHAFTVKMNYCTSYQIRSHADRLLEAELSDVDRVAEKRRGTISTFNGYSPEISVCESAEAEAAAASEWLREQLSEGIRPHEIGLFICSGGQVDRARAAAERPGLPFKVLEEHGEAVGGCASIGTMYLAKGLEFRLVAVMACDDEVVPLQERIESVGDDADLADVYATEGYPLYVARTRARDHLLVTGVEPASEFLGDLKQLPEPSGAR